MRKLIISAFCAALTTVGASCQLRQIDDTFIFDNMYMEALQAKLSGDYNSAFELLKTCRSLNPKSAAVLYEASTLLAMNGQYDYAAQYAQAAVEIDTTQNDNYVTMALQCLVKTNKLSETLPLYDTLIARRPDEANENRLMKVAVLQSINKYSDALKELDKIGIDDQRIAIQAQVQKALIFGQMGKQKKQGKILKNLLAKYPDNVQVNFQYSRFFYEKNDMDNAIAYCQKACNLPGGQPYLFVLADLYAKQKMDSLYSHTSIAAFKSPDIDVDSKLARIYDAMNRPDDQLTSENWRPHYDNVFYNLLKIYPDDPQVVSVAHSYYNSTGRSAKAQKLLTDYVEKNEGNEYMWRNILYYVQVEDAGSADSLVYYANKAVSQDDANPFYHLIYGQALQIKESYAASLREYQTAYKTYDNNRTDETQSNRIFALHGMAQCYTYLDSLTQAFAVYDQILSENPSDAVALNNYAYHLALHGQDLSKAEKMSQKSLAPDPLNATYLDTYAYILFREGKYTEALFVMERCVDQYKDEISAEVLDHYGDILNANGQADKALEQWNKAFEKEPDNATFKQKIDAQKK